MGAFWSLLGYPNTGRTDDPDPTTGLTSRDRYLLKTSWKEKIMINPTESGVALLVLFFKKHPKAKELFPFKDIPTSELSQNIRFKTHSNAVIYAVASIVDSVDNPELIISILEKTGKSHAPRGITEELFLIFGSSREMGAILSYLFVDKGRTDDHDPITGFTSRDKYLISTSWNKVMQDATGNGVAFFMRLFEINPKYNQAFPFRDEPTEDLPTDKKFQAHVVGVMYSVSSIIKNISDPQMMNSIIDKIMQNHVRRMVDRQALMDVRQALLDIFSFMHQYERESWTKFLDYFVEEGTKAVNKYSKNDK